MKQKLQAHADISLILMTIGLFVMLLLDASK